MEQHATSANSIVILRPMAVRPLNPYDIWSRHVQTRRVVYLDTNVWVRFTDARTPLDRECLTQCREAVSAGLVIFPLPFASLSELLQQPPDAPREAQAALMDELSLGVTLRSANVVHAEEARAAFRFFASENYQPVPRSILFTYVVDYLADGAIAFPEGSTMEQIGALIDYWNSSMALRSVSWLLQHMSLREIKQRHEASSKKFVELLSQNIKRSAGHFRTQNQFSSARLRHEERIALFQSTILPTFRRLMLERYAVEDIPKKMTAMGQEFNQRHGRGGPKVLEKLFSLMPATELFAQLMASRMSNLGRTVRPQDFWDIEHARVASAYADAFVTIDRGLLDLLNVRSSIPRAQGCSVIGNLESLAGMIRKWEREGRGAGLA